MDVARSVLAFMDISFSSWGFEFQAKCFILRYFTNESHYLWKTDNTKWDGTEKINIYPRTETAQINLI